MRKTCLFRMLAGCCLLMSTAGAAVADSDFLRMVRQSGKVMVVIRDAGQAGDFAEYAEFLFKRG